MLHLITCHGHIMPRLAELLYNTGMEKMWETWIFCTLTVTTLLANLIQLMTNWRYFFYFSQKSRFDNSYKLSPMETICMTCQILFSGEKNKKIFWCHLLKILPECFV